VTKKYYWLLAVFVAVYLATILIFQVDSAALARYHVSALQLRLLSLTILVPIVAIWFAAFYSIVNISKYTEKIKGSPDGEGFKKLTLGLIILGLSLPINTIISKVLSLTTLQHDTSQAFSTIITTHLSVLTYLFGFFFLFQGSRALLKSVKKARLHKNHVLAVAAVLVVIAIPYIIVILMNPSRIVAVAPATVATYYMSDWLIIMTIVIPYIVVWALGFYTTLLLHTYHQKVGGKIYRASLSKLDRGFFIVIASSILLQFLTSATTSLSGWGLGALLILVYVLLAIIAAGYILIALGAKGLAKLEEVT
jgi:hypothetical protein